MTALFLPTMISRLFFCLFISATLAIGATAQNTRLNDHNNIGWFAGFATFKFNDKWSAHTEYQWRRENYVQNWQQSLLRVGLNYQLMPKVQLRFGYAWIETFAYGEYPLNSFGKDFTEHRMFQMATLKDDLGRLSVSHRFLLEQRWVGKYTSPALEKEDEFTYLNRLRYMFRMQYPLKGETLDDKEFYAAAYDEIFVGFGKNVNENVFDQNRVGLLIGYRVNRKFSIEAGYLNQIGQFSREMTLPGTTNGRNLFQYNSGFIINSYFNLKMR